MSPLAVHCRQEEGAQCVANYLSEQGLNVVAQHFHTPHGPLAIAAQLHGGWMVGYVRVAAAGEAFTPPVGAFEPEVPYLLRRQASAWFNATGQIPHWETRLRLDAFGVELGRPNTSPVVHHVPCAYS